MERRARHVFQHLGETLLLSASICDEGTRWQWVARTGGPFHLFLIHWAQKKTERELKHTSRSEKTQTQKWKNLNLSSRWHCLSTHKKENMQIKGKWNFPFSYFFSFSLRFQGGSEGTKRKENPFISIIYTCVHPEAIGKISLTSFVLFFHSTGFLYTIIRNETHGCGPIYMNGYLSTCTFSTTTTNVVYTHTAHLECSVKTSPIWVGTLTTP